MVHKFQDVGTRDIRLGDRPLAFLLGLSGLVTSFLLILYDGEGITELWQFFESGNGDWGRWARFFEWCPFEIKQCTDFSIRRARH